MTRTTTVDMGLCRGCRVRWEEKSTAAFDYQGACALCGETHRLRKTAVPCTIDATTDVLFVWSDQYCTLTFECGSCSAPWQEGHSCGSGPRHPLADIAESGNGGMW